MKRLVEELTIEEKHLVHLELMIMEQASYLVVDPESSEVSPNTNLLQVADWELDIGKVETRYATTTPSRV